MEEDEEEEDELELARESSSDIPIYERETNIHFNEKNDVKHCMNITAYLRKDVTMFRCNDAMGCNNV